jgi:hypothetical protein
MSKVVVAAVIKRLISFDASVSLQQIRTIFSPRRTNLQRTLRHWRFKFFLDEESSMKSAGREMRMQ